MLQTIGTSTGWSPGERSDRSSCGSRSAGWLPCTEDTGDHPSPRDRPVPALVAVDVHRLANLEVREPRVPAPAKDGRSPFQFEPDRVSPLVENDIRLAIGNASVDLGHRPCERLVLRYAALAEAEAHAVRLAAFYDAHADAVEALVGDALGRLEDGPMKDRLHAAGPDYAAAAAARARSFVERGSSERAFIEAQTTMPPGSDAREEFCSMLATMQEEADVMCIGTGGKAECAYATLVSELSTEYC